MVENKEFQNRCEYCVNGICVSPVADEEKNKLEALAADASLSLTQLNRRIYQSMHIKNIATRLELEHDGVLDLPDTQRDKTVNETIMKARNKIKFSFSCFAHPKQNPCKSKKSSNTI